MIIKLQNGDKFKIESDEEARRKYKEHSLLSIGLKLKRNLNIASNFLKSGPNITNFGNAVSALFGGYSPEDPDLHYGEAPGVGIKNFGNLVRTARVAREFNDVVKGPVNLFRLLNNFIEKFVTNPKGSGKLIHYDKGNGKSIYQENRGASIINGKLIPGKTKREGLKDYTWWNTDNPYMNVHKAKEGPFSPTRYIVVDNNTQFKHPFDLKEPVGQSAGKGRGFIIKTERVTDKPVDLTNAEIYEKSPFGWWERIKSYQPKLLLDSSTSLKFLERKPSKISKAERTGVPKGERNLPKPSFKSELDWSPEGWFEKTARRKYNDGSLSLYTDMDIKELKSHIPEYLEIEARSKKNGTWLKMEDGSNWYGDPRSWVLMLSKNLKLHNPEDFWTGIHNSENFLETNSINPEYNGQIWGVHGQKFLSAAKARTYAPNDNLVFHMVSSKKTPTVVYDALGRPWYDIGGLKIGDQYITGKTTNEIINDNFSKGIGRVKINNVSDTGPNKIKTNSKYSTGDFITDWETLNSPGIHQNDIILSPGSFRKSLLGNNGAFNYKNKNIYRGLVPLTAGYTLYNLFNLPLQQLQYLKQGGKMNAIEQFKEGHKIHIKKKNRGKFTAYCGGNVTSACIAKAKASGNPTLVKRATFAANARKWKHYSGGKLFLIPRNWIFYNK